VSQLAEQVLGLIDACKGALAAKQEQYLDVTTMKVASAILEQAKADLPNDKILAAVDFDGPQALSWTRILTGMEIIKRSLPVEKYKPRVTAI
jgi:hypothetical protein